MNHYTWVYVAGGGRNVPVGLYHSSKKGHLLIYVGKKITTIDFNVLDSKEYTFFIDNELCRIKLERRGDKMFYFFEIDKTTDTPLNRARRAMERKFVRQLLIGLVVFVLVVSGFVIYMNNRHTGNAEQMEKMLARHGVETLGRVLVEKEGPHSAVSYQYIVHNQSYTSRHIALPSSLMVPRGGMPLETGDEFVVTYFPPDPEVSRIDLARPSQRQIQLYRQR
ncbi:MAG TPA: hypothetical protein ENJ20_02005, partial [Bacteroidetes bacterium]|nr:hypothetical protein [Bacteroidota bacterium]